MVSEEKIGPHFQSVTAAPEPDYYCEVTWVFLIRELKA